MLFLSIDPESGHTTHWLPDWTILDMEELAKELFKLPREQQDNLIGTFTEELYKLDQQRVLNIARAYTQARRNQEESDMIGEPDNKDESDETDNWPDPDARPQY